MIRICMLEYLDIPYTCIVVPQFTQQYKIVIWLRSVHRLDKCYDVDNTIKKWCHGQGGWHDEQWVGNRAQSGDRGGEGGEEEGGGEVGRAAEGDQEKQSRSQLSRQRAESS